MNSEIPRHWRLKEQRLRLIGEVCGNCDEKIFPPRDVCPHCRKEAKKKFEFSGKGEVLSFTVMQEAPAGYEEYAPYVVALVKLEEGPVITAQLTDLETQQGTRKAKMDQDRGWPPVYIEVPTTDFRVEIGMPVEMVTRKQKEDGDAGLIHYGYKFRPVLEVSQSQV